MKIKDHPCRAPCCYSQIHDHTKSSAKKHSSKEDRRSRNHSQKGIKSRTQSGRSVHGAQKVNEQGHIHPETDGISSTLSTASVSSSASSYFHAGVCEEKCSISSNSMHNTKHDGLYGPTSICSAKMDRLISQHPHKPISHRIQRKIQNMVEQLLREEKIAMEAWDAVAFEYHRRIETFTSLFVPHLLSPKLLYSSVSDEHHYLSGKSVLDVGAGTGAGALYAAYRKSSAVMAIDFSENMLKVLQNRIDASHCRNIQTQTANGLFLPFAWKNRYDVVFSNFALVYFPKVKEGVLEMARCAKPGGRVCLSGWGSREETQAFGVFAKAMLRCGFDRRWHLVQSAALKQQSSGRRFTTHENCLAPNYFCPTRRIASSQRYLRALMLEAGLVDVQVIPVTKELRFDDAEGYWNRFALASPNWKRFVDHCLSPEEISTLKRTVIEIVQEESSGCCEKGGVALKATAYIAVGTKACARKQQN